MSDQSFPPPGPRDWEERPDPTRPVEDPASPWQGPPAPGSGNTPADDPTSPRPEAGPPAQGHVAGSPPPAGPVPRSGPPAFPPPPGPGFDPSPQASPGLEGVPAPSSQPGQPAGAPGQMQAGGYGTWGAQTVRPGIIPLRPLALGDILDGALRAIRFNPQAMIGMAFAVTAVTTVIAFLVRFFLWNSAGTSGFNRNGLVTAFDPASIIDQLGTVILTGLLIHVVGEAVLGRKVTFREAWDAAKGKILPLLGFQILVSVVVIACVLTVIGILALPYFVYWLVVPAVIVLEKRQVVDAIRRSHALIKGAFWRTLGIILLTTLLVGIVAAILAAPIVGVGALILSATGVDVGDPTLASLLQGVSSLISGVLLTPFSAAVYALIYIDRRMRAEGLDVALIRHTQQGGRIG